MNPRGMELVAEYYAKKYQTNITLAKIEMPGLSLVMYADLTHFVAEINGYLRTLRSTPGDNYRHAFLIGASATHATPVVYIRENGQEGILLADSKGVNAWAAQTAHDGSGINVYASELTRQADMSSCYTDAMVFCRDTTSVNADTGEYYIPGLLTQLQSRAEPRSGFFAARLPNELLKTAQIASFVGDNREADSEKIIHKGMTLDQFRERKTDKGVLIKGKDQPVDIASYARKKGAKLANIAEIQFYLKQISDQAGDLFIDTERKLFIAEAKRILKTQGNLGSRLGLHEFAETFLARFSSRMSETERNARQQLQRVSIAPTPEVLNVLINSKYREKDYAAEAIADALKKIQNARIPFTAAILNGLENARWGAPDDFASAIIELHQTNILTPQTENAVIAAAINNNGELCKDATCLSYLFVQLHKANIFTSENTNAVILRHQLPYDDGFRPLDAAFKILLASDDFKSHNWDAVNANPELSRAMQVLADSGIQTGAPSVPASVPVNVEPAAAGDPAVVAAASSQPAQATTVQSTASLNVSFIWAGSLRDSTGIFKPSAIDRVCEMARKLPDDGFKINYYCSDSEAQALKNELVRKGFGNKINVCSIEGLLEELKDAKPDTDIAKYHQLMKYFSDHNMHNHIKEFLAPVIVYLRGGYFFDTTVMVDEEIGTINLPHPQGPLLASNPVRSSHRGGFGFRPMSDADMQKGALDVWAYASGQPKDEFYHELLDLFLKVFEFEFLNMDDRKWETSSPLYDYTKVEIGRAPNDVVAPMVFPVRQLSSKVSGRIQREENNGLTIDGEATGIVKVIKGSWRSIMLPDIRRMMLGKTNIGQDFKYFILAHENAVIKLVQHYMRTYGGDFDDNLSLLINPEHEALFRTEIAPFIKQYEEFSSRAAATTTVISESSAAASSLSTAVPSDLQPQPRELSDPQGRTQVFTTIPTPTDSVNTTRPVTQENKIQERDAIKANYIADVSSIKNNDQLTPEGKIQALNALLIRAKSDNGLRVETGLHGKGPFSNTGNTKAYQEVIGEIKKATKATLKTAADPGFVGEFSQATLDTTKDILSTQRSRVQFFKGTTSLSDAEADLKTLQNRINQSSFATQRNSTSH